MWTLVAAGLATVAIQVLGVMLEVRQQSAVNEARQADVILVLGAAEYAGRPSPVLQARLDHALELYQHGLAPNLLTTGGSGGDELHTEGEVARAYLSAHGVPAQAILVENVGSTTVESVAGAVEIMRRTNLRSAIVVSDRYHVFRVKKMLEAQGLRAYGSPRKEREHPDWQEWWLCARQAGGYLFWRIGVPI